MSDEIDLGVNRSEAYGEPTSAPHMMMAKDHEANIMYPTFTYDGPEELELPDEGEMTVTFKKVSETSETRKDGKHWYRCTVELRSIECVCEEDEDDENGKADEVKPPTRKYDEAGDALDRLAKAITEAREDKED